jgi:hypothetical protein
MEIKLRIEDSYVATFLALLKKLKYVKVEEMNTFAHTKENHSAESQPNNFQQFLLTAPNMSDADYQFYLEKRQDFNKWRQ